MNRILILGAGFAGLWAAMAAARKLDESGRAQTTEILVVDARPFHSIRVRNYELDPAATQVPLADVLEPIGVKWLTGTIEQIDTAQHTVTVKTANDTKVLNYARLVVALGSTLVHPSIPGLVEHAFDVDTFENTNTLLAHLRSLSTQPASAGRYTAVVIGAGLTGSEVAAELPAKLSKLAKNTAEVRVILIDHLPRIADQMGEAQPVIETAMRSMGVEMRPGVQVSRVTSTGVELANGETIAASTVIWCGGFHANPLVKELPTQHDTLGRIQVDEYLRVPDIPDVFAAGDCANLAIDGKNDIIMSCQYSLPMGRFCGHNVAANLLGEALLPLRIDDYVTCVDLGSWGAVYTQGRERKLVMQGEQVKRTKQFITHELIYPPINRNRDDILQAAAPTLATESLENKVL
ncbi:NADH dehydrogenase-like protein [Nitrosomonas stercoris]|uniref:NADH dehydrogenase-like protein n=1 Tax=Nitrosomonas stercoris TaxID=1444684 RepID=A0A4Y1YKG1_9PROT|nr:NADH dehydrogenase-like protein [Nitrosomonas stercoris]